MSQSTSPQQHHKSDPIAELLAPLRVLPMPKFGFTAKVLLGVFIILSIWALAIATFGIPAVIWPMKIIVPLSVLTLVLLTYGLL